ncbi:uncharacterized protein BJ171DRAFT_577552 [Polychytrium aggregatum]|uniref:uncharacterized protein n=1 Tax=Polychytrium aggregatum TaxID=110093 RepID=UPI0022FDE242|nr:uncharacterized protein BJ171DRAFT_577552 [Polychytrium aggregatum]KAI9208451.1 hypothetical protein BJ171DRAFT_577552 [Polychytrium aggregatum]
MFAVKPPSEPCPECNGSGYLQHGELPCLRCPGPSLSHHLPTPVSRRFSTFEPSLVSFQANFVHSIDSLLTLRDRPSSNPDSDSDSDSDSDDWTLAPPDDLNPSLFHVADPPPPKSLGRRSSKAIASSSRRRKHADRSVRLPLDSHQTAHYSPKKHLSEPILSLASAWRDAGSLLGSLSSSRASNSLGVEAVAGTFEKPS